MRSSIGGGPNKSIIRRRQVLSSILFGWLGSGGVIPQGITVDTTQYTVDSALITADNG